MHWRTASDNCDASGTDRWIRRPGGPQRLERALLLPDVHAAPSAPSSYPGTHWKAVIFPPPKPMPDSRVSNTACFNNLLPRETVTSQRFSDPH
jgi:hypothetical protein